MNYTPHIEDAPDECFYPRPRYCSMCCRYGLHRYGCPDQPLSEALAHERAAEQLNQQEHA